VVFGAWGLVVSHMIFHINLDSVKSYMGIRQLVLASVKVHVMTGGSVAVALRREISFPR
jgi:hypothetical protein